MKTIVEPKEHIDKLWGKQKIREGETYRMMRYVLRVDHEDKVLLHNVVTGRLVVLEREEAETLANLPTAYSPVMEQLVTEHYLVPEDYDEHQQVVNLRTILCKLDDALQSKDITHYTILPTTACNARCYYCFEQGNKAKTMTEQTVNAILQFITASCGGKSIRISWFGGEPLVAAYRIDQICIGLQEKGIRYHSDIITNGYLFDENLINKAANLWKLKTCQISVDGTGDIYNKIKDYVDACSNPYQRVMKNVGLLLEKSIRVNLRMNFDLSNYCEFKTLVDDASERFHDKSLLQLYVHPIIGSHINREGIVAHANKTWFEQKIIELNDIALNAGLLKQKKKLPNLEFKGCQATSDSSVTITPDGFLVRCPEQFDDRQIVGSIFGGINNTNLIQSWKQVSDIEMCKKCCLFPICDKPDNCATRDICYSYSLQIRLFKFAMVEALKQLINKKEDG